MILMPLTILLAQSLGYRPFLDPLPIWDNTAWPWLIVPLCAAVSLTYKSIRSDSMRTVPREALKLTLLIILGMATAAVVLAVVVRGFER